MQETGAGRPLVELGAKMTGPGDDTAARGKIASGPRWQGRAVGSDVLHCTCPLAGAQRDRWGGEHVRGWHRADPGGQPSLLPRSTQQPSRRQSQLLRNQTVNPLSPTQGQGHQSRHQKDLQ